MSDELPETHLERRNEDRPRSVYLGTSPHTSAHLRAQRHVDDGKAGGIDQVSLCI